MPAHNPASPSHSGPVELCQRGAATGTDVTSDCATDCASTLLNYWQQMLIAPIHHGGDHEADGVFLQH
jgi:hypothetical protein